MVVDKILGLALAFIGLTAFALAISKKSQTSAVVDSLLKGFQGIQATAISPVTGK